MPARPAPKKVSGEGQVDFSATFQALRAIRKAVGGDTPIIWTVFSPLMVLPFLLAGGRSAAVALMRSEPAAVDHALRAIAPSLHHRKVRCDSCHFVRPSARIRTHFGTRNCSPECSNTNGSVLPMKPHPSPPVLEPTVWFPIQR